MSLDDPNITLTHVEEGGRDSGMSINLTISIGYQRRRPDTSGDRLEARIDSVGLLIVGGVTVVVLILVVVPRVLAWIGGL